MTNSLIQDYDQAIEFLQGRINYERMSTPLASADFKLDRMRNLLQHLNNPHLKTPVVHIAGTKGKGTTATVVSEILQASGYQVGLFTSPHLHHYEERVRVNSSPIPRDELVELTNQIATAVATIDEADPLLRPTFFEVTTALGWLHFENREVDIAVLEVGLGGRLDSTNLCEPEVCVITTISKDHTEVLGDEISQIAAEKAGIIKPGVPIVCGVTSDEARSTIAQIASEREAPLIQLNRDFRFEVTSATLDETVFSFDENSGEPSQQLSGITLPLTGSHQAHNAACAVAAVQELAKLSWRIPDQAFREGCRQIRWPARVEVLHREPLVILDAAHNPASVDALLRTLNDHQVPGKKTLIYSSTRDKPVEQLLQMLSGQFDSVILTEFRSNPRAMPLAELTDIGSRIDGCAIRSIEQPEDAWAAAFSETEANGLICIAGSFFLAADLRKQLIRELALSH